MSQLLDTLVARLREHTLAELEAIAHATGVSPHLPRKLRSGERSNPTLKSIEPLLTYFGLLEPSAPPVPCMTAKGERNA